MHATPMYKKSHPVTWENLLDLPRKHRFMEDELLGLIWEAIQLSLNLDVLALNLTHLTSFQRESSAQPSYLPGGFPRVKHLRFAGPPIVASTVICRCTFEGRLDSLHLYSGIPSASVQAALGWQQNLKRLSLLIDTNVNVTDLPAEHPERVNLTMRPELLMDISRHFPILEWLVLAPSRTNAPRPFSTQSERQFFVSSSTWIIHVLHWHYSYQ